MRTFENFGTLLIELKNSIKIVDGLILENTDKYVIGRRVKGKFEDISLSQYRNSEDLILVETINHAFCVSRWDESLTISQQITRGTNN
tara:strand:+ start:243 stop:506 length:264 start_codon:yes stop_codon:yes gene_type:complete